MTEFEIFQLSNQIFINNAIYTVAVILMTALAFYLIRRSQELNFPVYGKVVLTLFCSFPIFFGLQVASYLITQQKNTSFQLSELKEAGVQISTLAEAYIVNWGQTVVDGPAAFGPDVPSMIMYATIATMFLVGIWGKMPEHN
ncbi:hypothetical protein N9D55_02180 [Flavobacteriaceae bacterium]|jgi:E3 ubiquitin-protein ligase DOA10|nr:hypothetical protein [Flavobacteriaceae bacterium]